MAFHQERNRPAIPAEPSAWFAYSSRSPPGQRCQYVNDRSLKADRVTGRPARFSLAFLASFPSGLLPRRRRRLDEENVWSVAKLFNRNILVCLDNNRH